jgi:hypothetical protein
VRCQIGRREQDRGPFDAFSLLDLGNDLFVMFGIGKKKERGRFYLFPGMGGRAYRRKLKAQMRWSLAAGLVASAIVAAILYLINRPGRH